MRINELTSPKTPEQQRIAALQATKNRAAHALAAERQRQKLAKAQIALAKAQKPITAAKPASVV